jgi:hypothetical protein
VIARILHFILELIVWTGVGGVLAFLGYCASEWEKESRHSDPAPPETPVTDRAWNPGGNSHQRRLARRRQERASKLGNV